MAMSLALASSLMLAIASASPIANTLPAGVMEMPLYRIVNQTAYGVEVSLGTPPQRQKVLIDTGSSYFGVQGTNSNWCKESTQPCKKYGSYDNLTSSTAKYINDDFQNTLINHGSGDYIRDTMVLGGKTFTNFDFGMILYYGASYPAPVPNAGLMGLIPTCITRDCTKIQNSTVLQALIARGTIKRNVLGIYFGENNPTSTGSLLFGAIDEAKQRGKAVTLPSVPQIYEYGAPNSFNYSSVSVQTTTAPHKTNTTIFTIPAHAYSLFDTGNPIMGLPGHVYAYVHKYLNIKSEPNFDGLYPVDCKYRHQQADNATLLFGFAKDTLKIEMPMNKLITQISADHCLAAIQNCEGEAECAFGDPFFRSVYSWFDFDKLTVTLSNVRYTNETKIVVPS